MQYGFLYDEKNDSRMATIHVWPPTRLKLEWENKLFRTWKFFFNRKDEKKIFENFPLFQRFSIIFHLKNFGNLRLVIAWCTWNEEEEKWMNEKSTDEWSSASWAEDDRVWSIKEEKQQNLRAKVKYFSVRDLRSSRSDVRNRSVQSDQTVIRRD